MSDPTVAEVPLGSAFQHTLTRETLRDYFAGQALAGMAHHASWYPVEPEQENKQVARRCYEIADAMLAERERKP